MERRVGAVGPEGGSSGPGQASCRALKGQWINYRTIALISHASKVMLKNLQARLQQTVNFLMFKLVLEKAEEPEINLPTSAGSLKKQESSRKTSISALLTMPKPLTVWTKINCGKFITLPTKVQLVKAMVFPVVMYGCESCTVKKAER